VTERPKRQVLNISGACEFTELEDGHVSVKFPLFGIEAVGTNRDDAFERLLPLLQEHLELSEIAREKFQEWAPQNVIEVEMTDEEIAQEREMDLLVEEGKKIGKSFTALDASSFAEFIAAPGPVLVDFWAEWCKPCHMLAPVLKEVTDELRLPVGKLNIDENPDIWEEIPSGGIPTMAVYRDGKRAGIVVGAGRSPAELKAELEPLLS
jgi:thioredoxin 1